MNYIIIVSFILIVIAILVSMFPRKIALYLSNVNKYDLESVPKRMIYFVFFGSMIILSISLFVFLYETSLVEFELPAFIKDINFLNMN